MFATENRQNHPSWYVTDDGDVNSKVDSDNSGYEECWWKRVKEHLWEWQSFQRLLQREREDAQIDMDLTRLKDNQPIWPFCYQSNVATFTAKCEAVGGNACKLKRTKNIHKAPFWLSMTDKNVKEQFVLELNKYQALENLQLDDINNINICYKKVKETFTETNIGWWLVSDRECGKSGYQKKQFHRWKEKKKQKTGI